MLRVQRGGSLGFFPRQRANQLAESYLGEDGNLYTDLVIGMPMMGRYNLAESPLLKELGHLRWRHLEALTGVPSANIADEGGNRLYPTFFFVEIVFPHATSMATITENDVFTVVSTIRRYGHLVLDGEHYLCPYRADFQPDPTRLSPETAHSLGIPYLRLSNVFVRQKGGAEWLERGHPSQVTWETIPEVKQAPTSLEQSRRVRLSGSFEDLAPTFSPLASEPTQATYRIDPDRDINGVGLLYFANYSHYLDTCEREALLSLPQARIDGGLLSSRSLVHRRSAYFSNASEDDSIEARIRCSVENPFLVEAPRAEDFPVVLHFDYQLRRRSDQRLMLVSSARKIIVGKVLGDTHLLSYLENEADLQARTKSTLAHRARCR